MQGELEAAAQGVVEYLEQLVEEVVGVCRVPAPPFGEQARAAHVLERFQAVGVPEAGLDAAGNVVARFPGRERGPGIALVAHLDTVFPPGTDTRPVRRQGRLYAPGVGDNSAGVAALIFVGRLLAEAGWQPPRDLWLVATVGEEGLGDLRGMRAFVEENRGRVMGVVCVDGRLGEVIHAGVASYRVEVTVRGPGGHSWGDYGVPSAVHVACRIGARLDRLPLASSPRTTLNIGVMEGGEAVNAVAAHARLVLDLRSESERHLAGLLEEVRETVRRASREGGLPAQVRVLGHRPGGRLSPDHPLVQAVLQVHRELGVASRLGCASTDANVPLSQGIPAVGVGVSRGAGAHSLEEWVEVASLPVGVQQLLLLLHAVPWSEGRMQPEEGESL